MNTSRGSVLPWAPWGCKRKLLHAPKGCTAWVWQQNSLKKQSNEMVRQCSLKDGASYHPMPSPDSSVLEGILTTLVGVEGSIIGVRRP